MTFANPNVTLQFTVTLSLGHRTLYFNYLISLQSSFTAFLIFTSILEIHHDNIINSLTSSVAVW